MSIRRQGESGRLAALAAVAIALVGTALLLIDSLVVTQASTDGAAMSLSINAGTGKVNVGNDAVFTVDVSVDARPSAGYIGVNTWIDYGSTGLAGEKNVVATFPDCDGAFVSDQTGNAEFAGCTTGLQLPLPPSFHKGSVFTFDLTCDTDNAHTILLLAAGDPVAGGSGAGFATDFVTTVPADHTDINGSLVADSIDVNCGNPPSPTPTETNTPGGPTNTPTPTPTPTNTPTNTPTPLPGPVMSLNGSGVSCNSPTPTPTPLSKPTKCTAQYWPGQEKRGEFQVTVNANRIPTPDGYGGFQSELLFDGGVTYNPRTACADEVVWPDLSAGTCERDTAGGNPEHEARSASAPAFPFSDHVGPLVELDTFCSSPAGGTITLTKASGPFPNGASYFDSDGDAVEVAAANPPHADVLDINCELQPPEMSLTAFGPGVECDSAEKPAKCSAQFVEDDPDTEGINEHEESTFFIAIDANAIPDGYGGFQTQTFFSGLKYVERSCLDEVIWRPDFEPGFVCEHETPSANSGNERDIIAKGDAFAPFPESFHVGRLVELAVRCPAENQFLIALPQRVPSNQKGTAFFNPGSGTEIDYNTEQEPVGSRTLDQNGNGVKGGSGETLVFDLLDILSINCEAPPPAPTPTVTPTVTPTGQVPPTATPTPCDGPCPTPTSTFTPTQTHTPTRTLTPTVTDTPTVTPTPAPPDFAQAEVPPGGKVTTGFAAEPSDPVETSVTLPVGGKVSIIEKLIVQPDPPGFRLFGQQVNISAPAGTAQLPLIIQFLLDESIIPDDITAANLPVFKGGILVPQCTSQTGVASPDPCVLKRNDLTGPAQGDIQIIIHSSTASSWNFGEPVTGGGKPDLGDVNGDGQINPLDALLVLFHSSNLSTVPFPNVADVNGDGQINPLDASLILQHSAGMITTFPAGARPSGIFWSWFRL